MMAAERNATGVPIDPVDGQPVFTVVDGEPYSRRRYLAAAPERRADTADRLTEIASRHRTTKEK